MNHLTSLNLLCEHFWSLRVTRESEELKLKDIIEGDKVNKKVPNLCQEAGLSSSCCNILAKLARSKRNLEHWPQFKQFKHGRWTFPFGAQRNLGYLSGQSQPAHVVRGRTTA